MNPSQKRTLQQMIETLQQAQKVAIFSHIRPDGDAYGSMLGLGLTLHALGKKVHLLNEDGLASTYQFLPGICLVQVPKEKPPKCDLVVSVDTSTQERMGDTFQKWRRKVDVNIDHHESNEQYGQLNLICPQFPATAIIIQDLIEQAGWPLTPDIAANLFVGTSTDTGSFKFRGTTAETFKFAARLVEAGADPAELAMHCYQNRSIPRFRLGLLALENVQLECNDRLALLKLTPEMFKQSGAKPEDTEGLIDKVQALSPVLLSVIFEFNENSLRVSLRSKDPKINVSAIAQEFGGGGHPLAAGIKLQGSPEENYQKILTKLRTVFE